MWRCLVDDPVLFFRTILEQFTKKDQQVSSQSFIQVFVVVVVVFIFFLICEVKIPQYRFTKIKRIFPASTIKEDENQEQAVLATNKKIS